MALAGPPQLVRANASSPAAVRLPLLAAEHRTTSLPVPYTLSCLGDAIGAAGQGAPQTQPPACGAAAVAEADAAALPVAVTRRLPAPSAEAEAAFRATREARTCRSFRGSVSATVQLRSRQDVDAFARLGCTSWAGSLQLAHLDMSSAEWYATFATLNEVEGGLIFDNVTGFGLRHMAFVGALALGRATAPATGRALQPVPGALRLTQPDVFEALTVRGARAFSLDGQLRRLVDTATAGRGAVRILDTSPAPCLTAAEAEGSWWAQPGLVELEYDASTCADATAQACPLHAAAAAVCVSACEGCGARCDGAVVSTRADLAALAGPSALTPCAYIRGGLIISGLLDVSEARLTPLTTIETIETILYVARNEWLLTLDAFARLRAVPRVAIEGNPRLVDARLPRLPLATRTSAVVLRNDRLCDAGMPAAAEGGAGCGEVRIEADYSTPALTQRVLDSSAGGDGLRDTIRRLLAPAVPGIDSDDVYDSLRLGPVLRLSIACPLRESAAALALLTSLGESGTLRRELASLSSVGLAFDSLKPVDSPRRRPAPGSVSSGLLLEATRRSDTVALAWTPPPGLDSDTRYVLDVGLTASTRTSLALTSYLLSGATDTGQLAPAELPSNASVDALDEYQLARAQAGAGLGQLFEFDTFSIPAETFALQLEACTRVRGGVLVQQPPSSGCLVAGQLYRLRLRGRWEEGWRLCRGSEKAARRERHTHTQKERRRLLTPLVPRPFHPLAYAFGDTFTSNEVEAQLTDESLTVGNLAVSSEPNALVVSWQPPPDADIVYSYEVQLRYGTAYNSLDVQDGGAADTLNTELLQLGSQQRLQVPASAKSVRLSGCFHDPQRNATHCITPFTAYRVALRAVGSVGPGLLTSVLTGTAPQPPLQPPRLLSASVPNKDSVRRARFVLQRPAVPTAVVAAFVLTWRGSQGQRGELTVAVPEPRLQQRTDPEQAFTALISSLDPYTTYTLNISTLTLEGATGAAWELNFTTSTDAPRALEPPLVTPINDGSTVRISWEAPSPMPANVTGYELRANFVSNGRPGDLLYAGPGTSVVVTSTAAGERSGLRVRYLTSQRGASPWSANPLATSSEDDGLVSTLTHPGVLAGICGGLVLLVVLAVVVRVRRRTRQYKAAEEAALLNTPQLDRWELGRDQLQLGRKLGEGAFGAVYEATVTGLLPTVTKPKSKGGKGGKGDADAPLRVAVKLCTGKELTDRTDFVKEAMLMKTFADPYHENVLRLLGVVTASEPMMIATEYMARGDLRNFLMGVRPRPGKETLSPVELASLATDVASGMAFLGEHRFVHRDLACRNCLVAEDMTCKVADFGLSRTLNYSEYYRKSGQALLPIRWMDPVCLVNGKFDTSTDVVGLGGGGGG